MENPYQTNTSDFWKNYLKGRPEVPSNFWQRIWNYHKLHGNANFARIHDLGSGPGVHATMLAEHFTEVTLTDPSPSNIEIAKTYLTRCGDAAKFSYCVGRGEDMDDQGTEAFDMVIACNSLHWMDPEKCLPAIASTLKPGGTFVAALFGFPDVIEERAQNVVQEWFCHGIRLILKNGAPPLFEYSILSQDSGYDCVEMRTDLWRTVQRVKLNCQKEYKGFGSGIREARPDIRYAISGSEEVLKEDDPKWYFKTDLQGLQDIIASFPLPNDTEYEAKMWKELGEIYQDKPVEGLYCRECEASKKVEILEREGDQVPVIAFLVIANWWGGSGWKPYITKLQIQIGNKPTRPGIEDGMLLTFRISQPRDATKNMLFKDFNFRYTELDHNLGSDENFQVAKEWIEACSSEHDGHLCPKIIDHPLPKRLIDVGPLDNTQHPKLVITPKGQKGRYLALSHCWGVSVKGERLVTNVKDIKTRKNGIPLASMPANFQDACIITRKLRFKYLWIDSLCIIQNSRTDWEIQSSQMGQIYTNASFTIAAAAAKDSDGGLLETQYEQLDFKKFEPSTWFTQDRYDTNRYALPGPSLEHQEELKVYRIPLLESQDRPTVSITPWLPFSDLEENWFRCVVVGPLAHRGWTLQERTLSYRTLYFGQRQIYWQCPSSRKAADGENVPLAATTSAWNQSSDHSEWPDLLGLKNKEFRSNSELDLAVHDVWRHILRIYASRRLTKSSDKLPALAGMAEHIHSLTGDEYVAGVWRRDILASLLWTRMPIWAKGITIENFQIPKPRWEKPKEDFSGPSWSWSSAEVDALSFWGASNLNRMWRAYDARATDINIDLAGNNPFGSVKKGTLFLNGLTYDRWDGRVEGWNPLIPGLYGLWDVLSDHTCIHSSRYEKDRVVLWDYPARHGVRIVPKFLRIFLQILVSILAIMFWHGPDIRTRLRKIHDWICPYCVQCLCIHILSEADAEPKRNNATGEHFYEILLFALILEPVKGQEKTYRRIGLSRKEVPVSEGVWLKFRESATNHKEEPQLPNYFSEWTRRTVKII
ncbi:hypothetical protein G7Y89_g6840 [Cudoniella acicularis]|uniref:Methyltransferase type 11 domain-containing protein n=1 Tax=Cudoniella acicularis TaxID=354080 RepID=A0A8H4W2H0_9HELO|nr:hypothetical protein G7Y89_g6840 [Cudoniella acicularis]